MLSFLHKYMALIFFVAGLVLLLCFFAGVAFDGAWLVAAVLLAVGTLIGAVNYAHTGTPFTESSGGH